MTWKTTIENEYSGTNRYRLRNWKPKRRRLHIQSHSNLAFIASFAWVRIRQLHRGYVGFSMACNKAISSVKRLLYWLRTPSSAMLTYNWVRLRSFQQKKQEKRQFLEHIRCNWMKRRIRPDCSHSSLVVRWWSCDGIACLMRRYMLYAACNKHST
jgi:hypothetical protein